MKVSHAFQSSSGTSPSSRAVVSTAEGWRTTTSAKARSGTPRASSHASQAKPGASAPRACMVCLL